MKGSHVGTSTSLPFLALRKSNLSLGFVTMRISTLAVFFIALICGVILVSNNHLAASSQPGKLQPNTLCMMNERIIFSCPVKRPAKIVSVCASEDLTNERGYLQY